MGKRATYVSEKQETSTVSESLFEEETKKKEFHDKDMIPCQSITVGRLHLTGAKSGEHYRWTNIGDVNDVEYRDLLDEVRRHTWYIYDPAFIILDEDFLNQHDDILVRYGQLYTSEDIERTLTLPAPQLKDVIKKMPAGAQTAVKDLAMRKISSGELDSVQRIKVLDEFFGTEMLLKLTQ